MKHENTDGTIEFALHGGSMAMYHSVKQLEDGSYRVTGWMTPEEKASPKDSIYVLDLTGRPLTIEIDSINYTNHPGIFGKYERRTAKDGDGRESTRIVELEPEHPDKINTRFEIIGRTISSKRKP